MKVNTRKPLIQSAQAFRGRVRRSWPTVKTWRAKGIAALRIAFGLVWVVAAWLKWQPEFQSKFLDQVTGAQDGQPAAIQAWIGLWAQLVSTNPVLFARLVAMTETALAVLLLLGLLSNVTYLVGIIYTLIIWSTAEGFGGPFKPGESTDIGTALPYTLLFALLLFISAGRYYGLDQWLTPRLGRFGFLASGRLWPRRKGV
jgi:thiosulfate dehydrogenase (quinone) large subunit